MDGHDSLATLYLSPKAINPIPDPRHPATGNAIQTPARAPTVKIHVRKCMEWVEGEGMCGKCNSPLWAALLKQPQGWSIQRKPPHDTQLCEARGLQAPQEVAVGPIRAGPDLGWQQTRGALCKLPGCKAAAAASPCSGSQPVQGLIPSAPAHLEWQVLE